VVNLTDGTKFVFNVEWGGRAVGEGMAKIFHPDHGQNPAGRSLWTSYFRKPYHILGIANKNPKTQGLTIPELPAELEMIGMKPGKSSIVY
jgi:hypothetical protein